MEKSRLEALINLLDDPDDTVFDMVEQELLKESHEIIPNLEKKWESSFDEHCQKRIEDIIQNLQFKETHKSLNQWINTNSNDRDLLTGFCNVDHFQYPDLNILNIHLKIENLRKSIWLELNNSLTLLEKVTILNHFLFNINGFTLNTENEFSPQNCFLNQLLETKNGNAVSLSIFYAIMARKLEIPARLIDFPKNPLVGIIDAQLAQKVHGSTLESDVLFYINPSNKGSITSRKEIEYHLKKNNYAPFYDYTEPKSDILFIKRLLESLKHAYQASGSADKENKVDQLLKLIAK